MPKARNPLHWIHQDETIRWRSENGVNELWPLSSK
jgi:hypothetical protein